MVLERHGSETISENARLLEESIQMPFSGRLVKSRFIKAAMSEYMAFWDMHDLSKRGIPLERLVRLHEMWGQAGYGIIITGNVMLHPEQLEAPGNVLLHAPYETPERMKQSSRVAAAGRAGGSLMIVQISHPGRQVPAFINQNPIGASDIKIKDQVMLVDRMDRTYSKPSPLDKAGILEVVNQFAYAAEAGYRTGFHGIQLHGAHGYLTTTKFANEITPGLTKKIPYLTGGFRTVVGMASAIRSGISEGVGIARPTGSDPLLPLQITQERVSGATNVKIPQNDIITTMLATGVQMELMARGKPVVDLSNPGEFSRFKDAARAHHAEKAERLLEGIIVPGYFVLETPEDGQVV